MELAGILCQLLLQNNQNIEVGVKSNIGWDIIYKEKS